MPISDLILDLHFNSLRYQKTETRVDEDSEKSETVATCRNHSCAFGFSMNCVTIYHMHCTHYGDINELLEEEFPSHL